MRKRTAISAFVGLFFVLFACGTVLLLPRTQSISKADSTTESGVISGTVTLDENDGLHITYGENTLSLGNLDFYSVEYVGGEYFIADVGTAAANSENVKEVKVIPEDAFYRSKTTGEYYRANSELEIIISASPFDITFICCPLDTATEQILLSEATACELFTDEEEGLNKRLSDSISFENSYYLDYVSPYSISPLSITDPNQSVYGGGDANPEVTSLVSNATLNEYTSSDYMIDNYVSNYRNAYPQKGFYDPIGGNDFVSDDALVQIIPKELFTNVCDVSYMGIEYGFHIKTRMMSEGLVSEYIIVDIECFSEAPSSNGYAYTGMRLYCPFKGRARYVSLFDCVIAYSDAHGLAFGNVNVTKVSTNPNYEINNRYVIAQGYYKPKMTFNEGFSIAAGAAKLILPVLPIPKPVKTVVNVSLSVAMEISEFLSSGEADIITHNKTRFHVTVNNGKDPPVGATVGVDNIGNHKFLVRNASAGSLRFTGTTLPSDFFGDNTEEGIIINYQFKHKTSILESNNIVTGISLDFFETSGSNYTFKGKAELVTFANMFTTEDPDSRTQTAIIKTPPTVTKSIYESTGASGSRTTTAQVINGNSVFYNFQPSFSNKSNIAFNDAWRIFTIAITKKTEGAFIKLYDSSFNLIAMDVNDKGTYPPRIDMYLEPDKRYIIEIGMTKSVGTYSLPFFASKLFRLGYGNTTSSIHNLPSKTSCLFAAIDPNAGRILTITLSIHPKLKLEYLDGDLNVLYTYTASDGTATLRIRKGTYRYLRFSMTDGSTLPPYISISNVIANLPDVGTC